MIRKFFQVLFFLLLPSCLFSQYFGEDVARPSSWSFGLKISSAHLDADITPLGLGRQGGIYFEKTLFRTLDLRIEAQVGQVKGLNLFASSNHHLNNGLNGTQNSQVSYDSAARYFHNYEHSYGSLGVHMKININRIITVLGAEKWDLYVLGGFGSYGYQSKIDALSSQGRIYDFSTANARDKDILQERLNDLLDGTYESLADQDQLNNTFVGSFALKTYFLVGGGLRFQLSEKIGLGAETNYLFMGDDLLDGQQWDENGNLSANRDKMMSTGLLLDFAF